MRDRARNPSPPWAGPHAREEGPVRAGRPGRTCPLFPGREWDTGPAPNPAGETCLPGPLVQASAYRSAAPRQTRSPKRSPCSRTDAGSRAKPIATVGRPRSSRDPGLATRSTQPNAHSLPSWRAAGSPGRITRSNAAPGQPRNARTRRTPRKNMSPVSSRQPTDAYTTSGSRDARTRHRSSSTHCSGSTGLTCQPDTGRTKRSGNARKCSARKVASYCGPSTPISCPRKLG